MFAGIVAWIRSLLQRGRVDREIDDELRFHLEMDIQANIGSGLDPTESRRRALRDLGGLAQTKEAIRDVRMFWFDSVLQDARFAARTFLKARTFTAVAVLTLSLCIGANSALFSVVDAVLLRPLPYEGAAQLYSVRNTYQGLCREYVSYSDFAAWRSGVRSFTHVAATYGDAASMTTPSGPEYLLGADVSEDFFRLFRVTPRVGRTFLASEHRRGQQQVVILGHELWVRRFGGDSSVIGTNVLLDGEPNTVVGVMPNGFAFPDEAEFWRPLRLTKSAAVLRVVARLHPGAAAADAHAQLREVSRQMEHLQPDRNADWGVTLTPLLARSTEGVRLTLLALWGAVACVLFIGCANIGILLLSRGLRRGPELALRLALGASRCRVVRQLLTESVLLGVLGGVGGVLVAKWSIGLIRGFAPTGTPRLQAVSLDLQVLLYTLVISLGAGLLAGIAPAWKVIRLNPQGLRGGAPLTSPRPRGLSILAMGQVVLSLVLLVGAGLMVQTLERLHAVDLGFKPDHLLTFYVSLPERDYGDDARQRGFYQELLERVRALPGVHSATAINALFIHWGNAIVVPLAVEGRPAPDPSRPPDTHIRLVDPDIHRVLHIPLVRGRYLTAEDGRSGSLAVVINETMAKRYFPGGDAIGNRVLVPPGWSEIVGIVGDVRQQGLDAAVQPEVQAPITQSAISTMAILVRTEGDPPALLPALRAQVQALDRNLPLTYIQTMDEVLAKSLAGRRFGMRLLSVFACLALILTAIGVYAVMATTTHERNHEIAVRLALGASPLRVLTTVVGQMTAVASFGVVIGIGAAVVATRYLDPLLFGVGRTDPTTYVAVSGAIMAVAAASSYLPARRAVRIDPATTLRSE
jgi:putative ABC transport system permease protein